MSGIVEGEGSESGQNVFRPQLQLPSAEGVRTIQRNRRGPMIRPSTSNSVKRFYRKRTYKDRAGLIGENNRTNHDHESLIESLLRQPLESGPPSKENSFSHQTDRYGPPIGQDDSFYEKYDATALPPSVIFTVPFFSNGKSVQISCRNVALFRAMVLLLSLLTLIIVVTVTSRLSSVNSLSEKKLRYIGGAKSKLIYSNTTESPNNEKDVTDHLTHVEKRGWVISKDTTMDIGFATDDMIFDQSNRDGTKGEDIGLNDDRLGISNYGNNTSSMKTGENNVDGKSREIKKLSSITGGEGPEKNRTIGSI